MHRRPQRRLVEHQVRAFTTTDGEQSLLFTGPGRDRSASRRTLTVEEPDGEELVEHEWRPEELDHRAGDAR